RNRPRCRIARWPKPDRQPGAGRPLLLKKAFDLQFFARLRLSRTNSSTLTQGCSSHLPHHAQERGYYSIFCCASSRESYPRVLFSVLPFFAYSNSGSAFSASLVAPGKTSLLLSSLMRFIGIATSCLPIPRNPPAPMIANETDLFEEIIRSSTVPIFSFLSL